MEYKKKSYLGFILWLLGFMVAFFAVIFLPKDIMDQTKILIAIEDNILTIGVFVLTFIIYQTQRIYWYNGTSYEEAKAAGEDRRKAFALAHMKHFGIFAAAFLVYSLISIFVGIPYGVDIAVAVVGLIAAAVSTIKIKL